MLHRLILKVTKFQLPPPKRLGTVVKNILGAIMPPMSNKVNSVLTLFDTGFFKPSAMGGDECSHHNFIVIAPMIMKFGTSILHNGNKNVTSLLLRHYDVITCILEDA